MKIKNSQKITVTIPTGTRHPVQIRATVKQLSEQLSVYYTDAIYQALKHIEEENINGISFTCANGAAIQVSLN